MAEVAEEEVNVFYIPHLRMKQLVKGYLEQVNYDRVSSQIRSLSLM
jgi:hypothetical protein